MGGGEDYVWLITENRLGSIAVMHIEVEDRYSL
jgi:hypothetical protein